MSENTENTTDLNNNDNVSALKSKNNTTSDDILNAEDLTEETKENSANNSASDSANDDNDLKTDSDIKASTEENEDSSYKDKFFYLAAEMDNLKKRHDRERSNLLKFGNEKILSSLLDVLDNLDRTLSAVQDEEDEKIKNICVGIEMVQKQFSDILTSNGLEMIETVGKTFDPNLHEAMSQQAVKDKEHHEIITEFQKGYILNGRLLRPAKVVIVNNEN